MKYEQVRGIVMIHAHVNKRVFLLLVLSSITTISAMKRSPRGDEEFWANALKAYDQHLIDQEARRKIKSARSGQKVQIDLRASAEQHIAAFEHNNMDRWGILNPADKPRRYKEDR